MVDVFFVHNPSISAYALIFIILFIINLFNLLSNPLIMLFDVVNYFHRTCITIIFVLICGIFTKIIIKITRIGL